MGEIIVLQHAECETPGTIAKALSDAGWTLRFARAFAGDAVPPLGNASGLVIMGGPMGVYEQQRYPYLSEEMQLIERALHAERPVLGICLGSQLLAAVLGAQVRPGQRKEIGWHEVGLGPIARHDPLWAGIEDRFVGLHWHGDVFDLPRDAVHLASSAMTRYQAFRYGRNAYGLLFHIEVTKPMVERMVNVFADELREAALDGEAIITSADQYLPRLQGLAPTVFGRWASLCDS